MTSTNTPEINDQLWRECASWLISWEILRNDHIVNEPDSTIADLACILRDGVLLCKLLNKIFPGCIDIKSVNLKPSMAQFLCLRNINLFLITCKLHFGLTDSDLFQNTMLFDLTDFHKVLCTLSSLSQSKRALDSGIKGFSAQVELTADDEIYQKLKADQPVNRKTSIFDSFEGYISIKEEIYEDLLVVRSKLEQPPVKNKKEFALREILDTEKNYMAVLSKLKTNYMLPLEDHMHPNDHACVFHKINELYDVHSPFLFELTKIRTNPKKLGPIFLKFKDQFLVYGSYCANLTKATNLLQELCDQNRNFNEVVIGCERDADGGKFKLKDLLVVPMQRMLKYGLLLNEVFKETKKDETEYEELIRAKEAMSDVADYINEEVRDAEHLSVIKNLQDTIVEWEVNPDMRLSNYGKLIKDAELKMRANTEQKTKNRYIFIFNKCILICKPSRGNQFAYRDILNILEYRVDKISNGFSTNNSFLLTKKGGGISYTVFVRTLELQNQLIEAITEAIDSIRPKTLFHTKHSLKLHTFKTPVKCEHCKKYLKGLIYQGYICTRCNVSIHKECIQFSKRCLVRRAPVPIPSTDPDPLPIHVTDYLRNQLWYVGRMDRETAERKLGFLENGTFLVRIGNDSYVLTLKTAKSSIEHMRISTTSNESGGAKKYYLSKTRYFNSVENLIIYYENYSLKENFDRLGEHEKLLYPYSQLKVCVIKDFASRDGFQLSVQAKQTLRVIGKNGYKEGFWKVINDNNQTGYVPLTVLKLEGEVQFDEECWQRKLSLVPARSSQT